MALEPAQENKAFLARLTGDTRGHRGMNVKNVSSANFIRLEGEMRIIRQGIK